MTDLYVGGCEAIHRLYKDAPDCCGSCHTDQDEYGYSAPAIYEFKNYGRYVEVCCSVANWAKNPKLDWRTLQTDWERSFSGD